MDYRCTKNSRFYVAPLVKSWLNRSKTRPVRHESAFSCRTGRLAYTCGYSDQSHLIRELRKLCGHTPDLFFIISQTATQRRFFPQNFVNHQSFTMFASSNKPNSPGETIHQTYPTAVKGHYGGVVSRPV